MVKKNAIYLVTEAVILSKQLKGKYKLLLPAQISFFFARYKPLPLVRTQWWASYFLKVTSYKLQLLCKKSN